MTASLAMLLVGCGGGHGKATASSPAHHFRPVVLGAVKLPLVGPAGGCHAASALSGGGERIPATIGAKDGQVGVSVNFCIDGHGPFPFVIDTGATRTAVETTLARRLNLPVTGPPRELPGVGGCLAHARNRTISRWNIAGFALASQSVVSFTGPGIGGPGAPVGLLGSDLWNRFGQLRIDDRRGDIVLPAREGPAPSGRKLATGATTAPLPRFLIAGPPAIESRLAAAATPQGAGLVIGIGFGQARPLPFLVDTGATRSLVQTSVATQFGLKSTGRADTQGTICSVTTTPQVSSGSWYITAPRPGARTLAEDPLHPQELDETNLGHGPAGLFGSDQMSRFGSVVFDYAGGRIFLGAG